MNDLKLIKYINNNTILNIDIIKLIFDYKKIIEEEIERSNLLFKELSIYCKYNKKIRINYIKYIIDKSILTNNNYFELLPYNYKQIYYFYIDNYNLLIED